MTSPLCAPASTTWWVRWPAEAAAEAAGTDAVYRAPMHLPVRTVRILCAAFGALLLPVALSACSSSTSSTATSTTLAGTTKDISKTACALMSPAEVSSIMGTAVGTPTAVVNKTVTTCRYKASKLSQSVLIEYQLDATGTSFSSDRSEIEGGRAPSPRSPARRRGLLLHRQVGAARR